MPMYKNLFVLPWPDLPNRGKTLCSLPVAMMSRGTGSSSPSDEPERTYAPVTFGH